MNEMEDKLNPHPMKIHKVTPEGANNWDLFNKMILKITEQKESHEKAKKLLDEAYAKGQFDEIIKHLEEAKTLK